MTRSEIAMDVLKPIAAALKTRWAEDACKGPLNAEGDQTRRDAAVKFLTIDALLIQLEQAIRNDT
jgi:hypothetical protein